MHCTWRLKMGEGERAPPAAGDTTTNHIRFLEQRGAAPHTSHTAAKQNSPNFTSTVRLSYVGVQYKQSPEGTHRDDSGKPTKLSFLCPFYTPLHIQCLALSQVSTHQQTSDHIPHKPFFPAARAQTVVYNLLNTHSTAPTRAARSLFSFSG